MRSAVPDLANFGNQHAAVSSLLCTVYSSKLIVAPKTTHLITKMVCVLKHIAGSRGAVPTSSQSILFPRLPECVTKYAPIASNMVTKLVCMSRRTPSARLARPKVFSFYCRQGSEDMYKAEKECASHMFRLIPSKSDCCFTLIMHWSHPLLLYVSCLSILTIKCAPA